MKSLILSIILLFTISSGLAAQEYSHYNKSVENKVNDVWNDGTYYVLVSAPWCAPCQTLKANLKKYPKVKIYTLDFDKDKALVAKYKPQNRGIPYFIRIEVVDGVKTTFVYNSNQELKHFVKPVETPLEANKPLEVPTFTLKPQEEAVEDQLYEGLFDRIEARLNNIESATDEKIAELSKDRETIFSRFSEILKNQKELEKSNRELSEFNFGLKIILNKLAEAIKSIGFDLTPLMVRFSEAAAERKTLLDAIKELREDRTSILSEIKEFREEKRGILATLSEIKQDRKGLLDRLAEAAKERQADRQLAAEERKGLLERWREQREEFKPLLNITERLNNWIAALTSSIWLLLGFILSVLFALVVVLAIVSWILSKFQKFGNFILTKIGLKILL